MDSKNNNSLLQQALEYHYRGWCVIPILHGSKKARIRWKKFQEQCPGEGLLRKWFSNNHRNIAVVLGEVSGGLTCRDFDAMPEYELWARKYPDLAQRLPTVKTGKGMHVYFEGHIEGIRHIKNGELRGGGGYCLLPPSIHPDGPRYQWVNPPTDDNLIFIEPELAGFIPNVTEHTERTEKTEQSEAIEGEKGNKKIASINEAISETLPFKYGTRNRKIFEFARTLKTLPQYAGADPKDLVEIVRYWHKMALPNIRTKEFEETWIDFLKAWPRVKYPIGKEPIMQIFNKALKVEPPAVAVEKYPHHTNLQLLTALCRELQLAAGDGPFYLSTRTAGRLMDVTPMSVSRWLFLLGEDGIIKVICKGGTAKTPRQASRFKYIAE